MRVKTYTKKDVVKRTAGLIGERIYNTEAIVDGVFQVLREMLCENSDNLRVEIRNFGVFEIKPTKAKPKARNPRTNEEIFVPPRKKTHFKPGKLIKLALKTTEKNSEKTTED